MRARLRRMEIPGSLVCWLSWHVPVREWEPRHPWDHPPMYCARCKRPLDRGA